MNAAAQQINLYEDRLRPRRARWRASQGLGALASIVVMAGVMNLSLDVWTRQRDAQAQAVESQVGAWRSTLQADPARAPHASIDRNAALLAELQKLRAAEATQHRIHALLDAQIARLSVGYTPYFLALSRQTGSQLWITGFDVSADDAVDLQGRMTDASALPTYLRRLNDEPQFRGRSFEQLSIVAGTAPGTMDFSLRARPSDASAGARK